MASRSLTPLDVMPVPVRGPDILGVGGPKDMRVAPHHLGFGLAEQRSKPCRVVPSCHQRDKEDGIEDVSKLLIEVAAPSPADRLKHLPCFLDQILEQGGHGLRPVPGAPARGPEPLGGADQAPEGIRGLTHQSGYVIIRLTLQHLPHMIEVISG
jgi:hypothetical protein